MLIKYQNEENKKHWAKLYKDRVETSSSGTIFLDQIKSVSLKKINIGDFYTTYRLVFDIASNSDYSVKVSEKNIDLAEKFKSKVVKAREKMM